MKNENKISRIGKRNKRPKTAITELMKMKGVSSYNLQKRGILNSGSITNASYEDIKSVRLKFFFKLAKGLHMSVPDVVGDLINLQKEYPPLIEHRKYGGSLKQQVEQAMKNK